MRTIFAAIILTFAALPVFAEKTPVTLELGAQLADVMRMRDMVDAVIKQCSDPQGSSFDAQAAFTSSPGSFGGISPQSSYWQEVEAIYAEYRRGACAYLTADGFLAYYAGVLAEKNSEEDLRIALQFYSSPAGKRFRDSLVFASVAFQDYTGESIRQATASAAENYQSSMRAVIRKYKKDPR